MAKSLLMPTSPMMGQILAPKTKLLVGKLVEVVNNSWASGNTIEVPRLTSFDEAISDMERAVIPVGIHGVVVGVTNVPTILKVLLSDVANVTLGIYCISYLNLKEIPT